MDGGRELDQALMWLCFLPQALLRKPVRGGRAGRSLVATRFNNLSQGIWGFLVNKWEEEKHSNESETGQGQEGDGLIIG